MKKIWDAVRKDLWIVLLDIIAVNAAYYLALLIRFYVGGFLRPVAVDRYLPAWEAFAPWYTILSILCFALFHLYGGIWRYAGINDMNRIILASVSTALLHFLGTTIFFTRMPWTYYLIGAVLQFVFVVCIRFGYRVLLVEKRRLRPRGKVKAVVVGSGENGRRVVKNLEESEVYKPIAVVGAGTGTMDGIPISFTLNLNGIGAVFIADPLLSTQEREKIRKQTEAAGVELLDYTGYFSNLGGRLSLTELMSVVKGPVTVELDGVETRYEDGVEALKTLTERYEVEEIKGMKLRLARSRGVDKDEAIKAAYAAIMGDDPPQGRTGR